jgi:hypothetical protein
MIFDGNKQILSIYKAFALLIGKMLVRKLAMFFLLGICRLVGGSTENGG